MQQPRVFGVVGQNTAIGRTSARVARLTGWWYDRERGGGSGGRALWNDGERGRGWEGDEGTRGQSGANVLGRERYGEYRGKRESGVGGVTEIAETLKTAVWICGIF